MSATRPSCPPSPPARSTPPSSPSPNAPATYCAAERRCPRCTCDLAAESCRGDRRSPLGRFTAVGDCVWQFQGRPPVAPTCDPAFLVPDCARILHDTHRPPHYPPPHQHRLRTPPVPPDVRPLGRPRSRPPGAGRGH